MSWVLCVRDFSTRYDFARNSCIIGLFKFIISVGKFFCLTSFSHALLRGIVSADGKVLNFLLTGCFIMFLSFKYSVGLLTWWSVIVIIHNIKLLRTVVCQTDENLMWAVCEKLETKHRKCLSDFQFKYPAVPWKHKICKWVLVYKYALLVSGTGEIHCPAVDIILFSAIKITIVPREK